MADPKPPRLPFGASYRDVTPVLAPYQAAGIDAPGRALKVGDCLSRLYRGKVYTLYVVPPLTTSQAKTKEWDRYWLSGVRYRTLSAAARAITGYPIQGPMWWGLRRRRR